MKELLQYVVERMVDKPDEVSITETTRDGGLVFELRVAPGDIGKVIGKGGCMAKDLRTLVKAASKDGQRVTVDIIDK